MLRLSRENKKQIKIILDGIFKIYLKTFLNRFKPKKYQAYQKYVVISAVYNVEKYLKDYFNSIIHQRLDFKNNILLILVDDGSTDKSATIIKAYQKKYPKNIIYLYKENGGQASARNLGLKYLEQNLKESFKFLSKSNNKNLDSIDSSKLNTTSLNSLNSTLPFIPTWVSFTDPDDFLDRDCFYKVDKFLNKNKNENLVMIACNIIFYFEKFKIYKDNHPLNFKFKKTSILTNQNLNDFIQLSCGTAFFFVQKILKQNIKFDEDLKPNFEDAKFVNEFLLENLESQSVFLKTAKYFYRKRKDKSSTLDNKKESDLKQVLKLGYLLLLLLAEKKCFNIPNFIQNTIIYDLYWVIKDTINNPNKFNFHTIEERKKFFKLFDKIFSLINAENILNFNVAGFSFFYKVGILHCFKNEYPSFHIAYIEDLDDKNEQILIRYFTPNDKDTESIKFDGAEIYADYKKIVKHCFLNRVFCYEKRLWVKMPQNAKKLEIFIKKEKSKIYFEEKELESLTQIDQRMRESKVQRSKNDDLWLFADMAFKADDNAEHLYRYIAKNHPEQNIIFALRKNSKDYERLQKEGFKLIDPKGLKFKYCLHKADKVISSHIDKYIFNAFGGDTLKTKDFIFLQHGVIKDNLSAWLNKRKIDCFITATKAEYKSIAKDYNEYKFSSKEVVLTGLARHDNLLKNNTTPLKQILIMPTWRQYLVGEIQSFGKRKKRDNFVQSKYYRHWKAFLDSKILRDLMQKYHYQIIFNPHPRIQPYLKDFELNSYIRLSEGSCLQKLFIESALLITDYSSVAFEMAYLKKPVLYYQFDKEEFFANHIYQQGYFSYEEDGFGAVSYTEEELLKELENLLAKDCKSDEPYKSRIENTFEFRDGKCCERIYKKIKDLS